MVGETANTNLKLAREKEKIGFSPTLGSGAGDKVFHAHGRGLCSLPPLRVAGAKPERPCNLLDGHTRHLGVMETNRAVVGVAHRSHSLDIDIRCLLHYIIYEAQNLDARASRFTRGTCTSPPPIHQAFHGTGTRCTA